MSSDSRVLRTPEARFDNLPDFPFVRRSVDLADETFGPLRMAYVDEGAKDRPVVLMLHGEPTWSFLYRKMIGPIVAAGFRAVAPDHIGFGASDKPVDRGAYTYQNHVDWMLRFVAALDLKRITLVCQDWGGPIGLRVLSETEDRFDAVVAATRCCRILILRRAALMCGRARASRRGDAVPRPPRIWRSARRLPVFA
jgi:haloalkane dehalogenase